MCKPSIEFDMKWKNTTVWLSEYQTSNFTEFIHHHSYFCEFLCGLTHALSHSQIAVFDFSENSKLIHSASFVFSACCFLVDYSLMNPSLYCLKFHLWPLNIKTLNNHRSALSKTKVFTRKMQISIRCHRICHEFFIHKTYGHWSTGLGLMVDAQIWANSSVWCILISPVSTWIFKFFIFFPILL